MRRSKFGYLLLLLAATLLVIEAVSVLARFAAFAGASEAVALSRWQWSDAVCLGAAGLLVQRGAARVMIDGPGQRQGESSPLGW